MIVDHTQFPQFKTDMLSWLSKMESVYDDPNLNADQKNDQIHGLLFYAQ